MITQKEYFEQSQDERQKHLRLDEECRERGGISSQHRGVLAQFLDVSIFKRPAMLCHACHNAKCSNPRHLYWGTCKENVQDSINNGTHLTLQAKMINKYGAEETKEFHRKAGRGNLGNKHTDKFIRSQVKFHLTEDGLVNLLIKHRGVIRNVAKEIGCSWHTVSKKMRQFNLKVTSKGRVFNLVR